MIELEHTYKVYPGPVRALNDVNLRVEKGEFVFLTGPSGAGKTTLFRIMSAFDRPTSGNVKILNFDLTRMKPDDVPMFRRHIGVVYQDFRLLKRKTIFENVALPLQIRREGDRYIRQRTEDILDQVGLLHKKSDYPDQLSGGEQQRVAIARALVHHPGLLIADEPTGNLDTELAEDIIRLLEKINAQGTTVFVATHDMSIVEKHHHKRVRIKAGELTGDTK